MKSANFFWNACVKKLKDVTFFGYFLKLMNTSV